jgi:hypothetical protein
LLKTVHPRYGFATHNLNTCVVNRVFGLLSQI